MYYRYPEFQLNNNQHNIQPQTYQNVIHNNAYVQTYYIPYSNYYKPCCCQYCLPRTYLNNAIYENNFVRQNNSVQFNNSNLKTTENELNVTDGLFDKSINLFNQKKYKESIGCLDKIIGVGKKLHKAYFCKAVILMICRKHKDAISFFWKTLKTRPCNTNSYRFESYRNMGLCLYQTKEYDLARKSFELALKIKPKSFEVHFNLGLVNKYLKRYDEAIQNFTETTNINPSHNKGFDNLKFCQYKKIQERIFKRSQNKCEGIGGKIKITRKKISIADICNEENISVGMNF